MPIRVCHFNTFWRGWVDSALAADPDIRQSVSGFLLSVNCGLGNGSPHFFSCASLPVCQLLLNMRFRIRVFTACAALLE